jgi:methionyl-tRNA formyltransferase
MRIAFFGLPLGALRLVHDGHEVVLAAISRSPEEGAVGMRRLLARLGRERVMQEPDVTSEGFLERARSAKPDIVVSWFWTTRIPMTVVGRAHLGGFGVHPSLLPRHRGPDPYFWAIEAGDAETGVTAHRIAEDYDTGAILAQRRLAIDPSWSSWKLARALDRPSLALLCATARAFAEGTPPREEPQDEARVTLAPAPTEELLALRWGEPSARIERRVRAAGPWPGAFTEIGEALVTLTLVRPTADYPRALAPGEAAVHKDGSAIVRTGDSAVELLQGRDEDERPLDAAGLARVVHAAR